MPPLPLHLQLGGWPTEAFQRTGGKKRAGRDYNICPQGSCGGPCGPLPPNPGKTCMVEPQPYGTEPKFLDHESKSNDNNIEEPHMEPLSHEVDHKPLNVENTT